MKHKSTNVIVLAGCVAALIAIANSGGSGIGGTFSVTSKTADAEPSRTPGGAETASRGAPAEPADHTVTTRSGEPSVITYKTGEGKIDQSIDAARAHLDYFWRHQEKPQSGERTFTLKVAFPVAKDGKWGREHIWVTQVERNGATLSGRLDNTPDLLTGVKSGDTVTFTEDMITDWGFASRAGMIGFYSTRVMLEDAPPAEAAKIRAMLGENPA